MQIPAQQITGLVLAGGRGSRMGGVDKGLQPLHGRPLVAHVLQRLAPQVGQLAINANRNLQAYGAFGHPVWPDAGADHPGPLAGLLAGLTHCSTPWLLTVPCDTPHFPADLAARLAAVAEDIALPCTLEEGQQQPQPQPVFCLVHRSLRGSVEQALARGEHKVMRWATQHRLARVRFDDSAAFFNANTPHDLALLERGA
jgi:molybdenum cofactor guanylyltransferase